MRSVLFVLQFTGTVEPREEDFWKLTTKATASGQSLTTAITASGITCSASGATSGTAFYESSIEVDEEGAFTERGTMTYGGTDGFTFETLRPGIMLPLGDDGGTYGSAILRITSGTGIFKDAEGTITANFRASGTGEMVDMQVANIHLAG